MMIGVDALFQADATVIAGVLILLTIVSLKFPLTTQERQAQRLLTYWLPAIMIPFVVSAILLFLVFLQPQLLYSAEVFTAAGFVYLIVVIILILRLPLKGVSWVRG